MYLIAWKDDAFDQMQHLLDDHPDQRTDFALALRSASTQINQAADTVGESRGGTDRVVFAPPLAVYYELDDDQRLAHIFRVTLSVNRRR